MEEGQTKDRIIMLLKKTGGLTAEDLSRHVGITPMGIRQHLLALERKGMVEYEARKHGIGRPVFIYKLTDKADEIFPKGYHQFSIDMLRDLEALDGRGKIKELFRMRKERLLKEKSSQLNGAGPLSERLKALSRLLENDGYIVELKTEGSDYVLSKYNCPLSRIASVYNEACFYEVELLKDLLGAPVVQQTSLSRGDTSCGFRIPLA
ncbi:MAG: transcriptional regulator [Nitrospiraceae bacterium]|nr:transcriptional regulator [Nitrospiraceae bacterium]